MAVVSSRESGHARRTAERPSTRRGPKREARTRIRDAALQLLAVLHPEQPSLGFTRTEHLIGQAILTEPIKHRHRPRPPPHGTWRDDSGTLTKVT
jgi:hypothetical protein